MWQGARLQPDMGRAGSTDSSVVYMQGFQFLADDLSGFGHFSYELLQQLGDDFPRSPIKLYALRMSQQAASTSVVR